jgi:hypothetical protein
MTIFIYRDGVQLALTARFVGQNGLSRRKTIYVPFVTS